MEKTSFAIGCLIQWYEVDIVHEYLNSLKDAIDNYDMSNIIIDITINVDQTLEKATGDIQNISQPIIDSIDKFSKLNYNIKWRKIDSLYTIADYRRNFNEIYCEHADVLIWGETDMLVPKQMFTALDILHQSQKDITPKYLATFGICKMWDRSWEPLEHVEFTNKPFIENDYTNWWSLKYTMTLDEMNAFNNRVDQLDVRNIMPHKFNGCGLVISAEVIKCGVNIPKSVFFVHEDSAFMLMANRLLGEIPQYHFKNILMVHNRNHPNKRNYIQNEAGNSLNEKRRSNDWYVKANKYSEQNCYNLFNPNYKSLSWNDIL